MVAVFAPKNLQASMSVQCLLTEVMLALGFIRNMRFGRRSAGSLTCVVASGRVPRPGPVVREP